jgi:hypothetical protein
VQHLDIAFVDFSSHWLGEMTMCDRLRSVSPDVLQQMVQAHEFTSVAGFAGTGAELAACGDAASSFIAGKM